MTIAYISISVDLYLNIERMFDLVIVGFKFSSFSQRFDIASEDVEKMLMLIKDK